MDGWMVWFGLVCGGEKQYARGWEGSEGERRGREGSMMASTGGIESNRRVLVVERKLANTPGTRPENDRPQRPLARFSPAETHR